MTLVYVALVCVRSADTASVYVHAALICVRSADTASLVDWRGRKKNLNINLNGH